MKILHLTPSTDGYEEVTLLANRVNRKNHFSVIEKDGVEYMTGGFILNNTPEIRKMLDSIPKSKQYDFIHSIKMEPFVKFYLEEDF
jgi:hypothetical protein